MKSSLTFAIVMLATIAACAEPNLDEPEPQPIDDRQERGSGKGTSTSPSPSSGTGGVTAPPPSGGPVNADPPPEARRWKGTLAATKPLQFGGGQVCVYRITLEDVEVDVHAATNGDIVGANVTAIAFEELVSGSCGTPIPAHTHTYSLAKTTMLPSGVAHLELSGPSTNDPPASLVIEADFRNAHPALSLEWHRTNAAPPLDWRVRVEITASPT